MYLSDKYQKLYQNHQFITDQSINLPKGFKSIGKKDLLIQNKN